MVISIFSYQHKIQKSLNSQQYDAVL